MSSHTIRIKRGKKRYYPKSPLRRAIKAGMKRRGASKRQIKKATHSSWW